MSRFMRRRKMPGKALRQLSWDFPLAAWMVVLGRLFALPHALQDEL